MVRAGEIEHGIRIAQRAEAVWCWASAAGQKRATRRAELIIRAAELGPGMRVLELGCGTGVFTERFLVPGCRIVAVDVSEPLLTQARARCTDPRVAFHLDDAEQLSFSDCAFDAVIGSSVLHHLDLGYVLSEMRRVLVPGGTIAFAEPNKMNPQIALQLISPHIRRWMGVSPEETAFSRWRIATQLKQAGFTGVHVQPFDFLHPSVPKPLTGAAERLGLLLERIPAVREIAGSLIITATSNRRVAPPITSPIMARSGRAEPVASVGA